MDFPFLSSSCLCLRGWGSSSLQNLKVCSWADLGCRPGSSQLWSHVAEECRIGFLEVNRVQGNSYSTLNSPIFTVSTPCLEHNVIQKPSETIRFKSTGYHWYCRNIERGQRAALALVWLNHGWPTDSVRPQICLISQISSVLVREQWVPSYAWLQFDRSQWATKIMHKIEDSIDSTFACPLLSNPVAGRLHHCHTYIPSCVWSREYCCYYPYMGPGTSAGLAPRQYNKVRKMMWGHSYIHLASCDKTPF